MESIRKYYQVNPKDICFLKFVIEACDHIAVFSTIDSKAGIVAFRIPPGCESEVNEVLEGLKTEIPINDVSETIISSYHRMSNECL